MRFAKIVAVLLALVGCCAVPALAFQLPGLDADASRYESSLRGRAPAQPDPAERSRAASRATSAASEGNWGAAAAAWEVVIAHGGGTVASWLGLAEAQSRRQPPQPQLALAAAWQAFQNAPPGTAEITPLLRIADLLAGPLNRPLPAIEALEAVIERAPGDASYLRRLAYLRRTVGLLVRSVETEPESDPPRACIALTGNLAPRPPSGYGDFVTLEPRPPELAISVAGDRLCLENLAHGTRYRVTLREGLPGAAEGVALRTNATLDLAMGNRAARVAWDSRGHVLPRGQGERLSLTTINLSEVSIRIWRVGERSLVRQLAAGRTGSSLAPYEAASIAYDRGRLVHEARLNIPSWQPNRGTRTAFDLPNSLRAVGPGLFLLQAIPSDGTPVTLWENAATQWLLVTDLALTALRGSDGLTLLVRDYEDAVSSGGVTLALLARNNEILGTTETDSNGVGRFPASLLRGQGGLEPIALTATSADGSDFAWLDLTSAAFDLSDRGAGGQPHPGPVDAFVWLDRGIYRPGETVQVQALVRTDSGDPLDLPLTLRLRRPNGLVLSEAPLARDTPGGFVANAIVLSPTAPFGTWRAELLADRTAPPVGVAEFRVEAFVPERLAVTLDAPNAPVPAGQPINLGVAARFLYGPPAAGLAVDAELVVERDPSPFPALPGYRWGLAQEPVTPERRSIAAPATDPSGRSAIVFAFASLPDTTAPLRTTLGVAVAEPGGRPSRDRASFPLANPDGHVGIRPLFGGDAVDAGAEAHFELRSVGPIGEPRDRTGASISVVRERPNWRLVVRGGLARYETTWRDEPVFTGTTALPASPPARFAQLLPPGRYRIEVADRDGRSAASYRFRVGWSAGGDETGVPDRLDLAADRAAYADGDTARLTLEAPFGGTATLAIVTDRVQAISVHAVTAGRNEFTVPVDPGWGPGAHAALLLHRPRVAADPREPLRALGLAWIGLDPASRRLDVAIETPDLARPRTQLSVPVRVAGSTPETRVWLAAVDEGILRLTSHASPDPARHFAGRRRLGIEFRDDYGRLVAPAEGQDGVLRQGGDELDELLGAPLPVVPFRILAVTRGPVTPGADGIARIPLELPDFQGEIRLMAVAWDGRRTGSAAKPLAVRDPLVVDPSLPRFLAPLDEARITVSAHNVELPAGPVRITADVAGAGLLLGDAERSLDLAAGVRATTQFVLRGTEQGVARLALTVEGPDGFRAVRRFSLAVQSARSPSTTVSRRQLPPGDSVRIDAMGLQALLPGTTRVSISAGIGLSYDPATLMRALEAFRYGCLEQVVSQAFPLAVLADEPLLLGGPALPGDGRLERLQAAIAAIFDKQRFDGGFGLWSPNDEPDDWAGTYALEFLLRARGAGAPVPDAPLAAALRFIDEAVGREAGADPAELASRAYRLWALALAGQPRPGAMRLLAQRGWDRLPTPLARAQLAAAFARVGDAGRAREGFEAALRNLSRDPWMADFGSAERDAAAILLLLHESRLLPERRPALLDRLRPEALRPNLTSTQEQAWAVAATAALSQGAASVTVQLDGRPLPSGNPVTVTRSGGDLAQPIQIRNAGGNTIWIAESVTGVARQAPPAVREGMQIRRQFLHRDGTPVALDAIRQNDVFLMLLEGSAETNLSHRAIVEQGLPAGWEIEPLRLGPGVADAYPFLGELTRVVASASGDDRFAAALDLTREQRAFRLAFLVRAVTEGVFELPGARVEDMYRPRFGARQGGGRIEVGPAR